MGFWFTILLIASIVLTGMFIRMKNIINAYEDACNKIRNIIYYTHTRLNEEDEEETEYILKEQYKDLRGIL